MLGEYELLLLSPVNIVAHLRFQHLFHLDFIIVRARYDVFINNQFYGAYYTISLFCVKKGNSLFYIYLFLFFLALSNNPIALWPTTHGHQFLEF